MRTININTPGPQGAVGPQGAAGPSGSTQPFSNVSGNVWATTSSLEVTGSFIVSGSSTFTNIGPAVFSGSVNATSGVTMSSALVSGDVIVLGTASINVLQINTTINSTGSNTLGDNANDTQTLYGSVIIPTGSLAVSGNVSFGTSSAGFYWNNTNSRLGIGTAAPAYDLSVEKSVGSSGAVLLSAKNTNGAGEAGVVAYNDLNEYSSLEIYGSTFGNTTLRRQSTLTTNALNGFSFLLFNNAATCNFSVKTGLSLTERFRVFNNTGNVLIQNGGTFTDAGFKLDVNGSTRVKGSGATNATTALRVENTNTSASLVVLDNGFVGINTGSADYNLDVNGTARVGVLRCGNINPSATTNASGITIYLGTIDTGPANDLRLISKAVILSNDYSFLSSPSAFLEVKSTTKGFLPPRTATTASISSPAQGLITYLTGSTNEGLYYYNSGSQTGWHRVLTNTGSQSITGSLEVSSTARFNGDFNLFRTDGIQFLNVSNAGAAIDFNPGNNAAPTFRVRGTSGVLLHIKANEDKVSINNTAPSAMLHVRGSGATSATTALRVENSNASASLVVLDSGTVGIGTSSPSSTYLLDVDGISRLKGTVYMEGGAHVSQISPRQNQNLEITATWADTTYVRIRTITNKAQVLIVQPENNLTLSAGTHDTQRILHTFAPTTGSAVINALTISQSISQSSGVTGITRGLYVNPILTAAADYRAIETTSGSVLFSHGATSLMSISSSGNVGINTTASSAYNLDVNGTMQVSGNINMPTTYQYIGRGGSDAIRFANAEVRVSVSTPTGNFSVYAPSFGLTTFRSLANGTCLINTTSENASAVLQADSTTKGFLPPRMTNAQRVAISTPAVGLMVYCTDVVEGLYINKSTGWTFIA